jgi:nucleoid-associated protein YgaU
VPAPPADVVAPLASGSPAISTHTVLVQPGDSLWSLAARKLGRGSRWHDLLAANPGVLDPNRIAVGTQLLLPFKESKLKADVKVTVQKGDSLSKIAQSQYGRAENWQCIAQANPQLTDANRIYEGQELLVPANCKR